MQRAKVIRRIRDAAKAFGKQFEILREGGNHEIWICGNTRVPLPRHREINQFTAEGIFEDLEAELGADWWR
jgi:hypothetical protein